MASLQQQRQKLLEWAWDVFREEGPKLLPRIATLRDGELQTFTTDPAWDLKGLAQAASVLSRTVGDDDVVMALGPGNTPRIAKGIDFAGWGAVADLRSRSGHFSLVMLGARMRGGSVHPFQADYPKQRVSHLGNWIARGYPVDPWLELHLEAAKVPGAAVGAALGPQGPSLAQSAVFVLPPAR